jgi:hypothetical protein
MARPFGSAVIVFLVLILAACASLNQVTPSLPPTISIPTQTPAPLVALTIPPATSLVPTNHQLPTSSPTPAPLVPDFAHIVLVVFENKEFTDVIGIKSMPVFNQLAKTYTLLTQHYAVTHPSLPNYIALTAGDFFDINRNCEDCFINTQSLSDQIEASGRTWKTYQESMPKPCFIGNRWPYAQKHNPFIYYDPIRLDPVRCQEHIVPLTQLDADLANNALPNFIFITPNLCNDAHDCYVATADAWMDSLMKKLTPALDQSLQPYLIVITWDEGSTNDSCCGLPPSAGGRIPTVFVSPQVKRGFEDGTPYTLYSLLKTIETSWGLPWLGHAADETNLLITAPWN